MKTRNITLISFVLALMPCFVMAQSADDLYYIPKKVKSEKTTQTQKSVLSERGSSGYETSQGKTVMVRDANGNLRNIDEYNRRYNSRNNRFTTAGDTLYIEEKPYGERGEWINGFEGSQDDYEYAMRLIRFRNPRYAVSISSPLYWDIVHGAFASWDWNVYDDGFYAYVFPRFSNRLWWNWRYSWGGYYGFGWGSPWYYSGWGSPYYGWGGYYGHYWGYPYDYWAPYYHGWGSGYYKRYNYNDRRNYERGGSINRSYNGNTYDRRNYGYTRSTDIRNNSYNSGTLNRAEGYTSRPRTGGRVITTDNQNISRNTGTSRYVRSTQSGTTYTRPSSTRSGSYSGNGAFERMQNNGFQRSSSSSSFSSGSSSSRSSFSSGGSSSGRSNSGSSGSSSSGGGARRR